MLHKVSAETEYLAEVFSFLLSFSPDDGVSVEGEDESDAGGGVASGGHRKPYSNDNEPALNELREPLLDDL